MTVIALLSVAPVVEGSMAGEVAKAVEALDDFDVSYETNPMGTVIEADDIEELMAAATAAHRAVDGDRVSTVLKIDDKRTRTEPASEKVEAVERELGRPARSDAGNEEGGGGTNADGEDGGTD
ncbi:MTH1187 family thiamine-binding protein [Halorarum halophilum]|uniref:MTH1187 family thiamine-binding protein n=1 Tax=Halorarum halophilum TaxID=2743090 RepID=A0A7D5KTC1_9EURY|nr:MTH1187 family thiamine-binding protein [Halobaculum halophilum]QLG26120.1 MTH1187 family thiamine-binding protein [Halobaculum halophilum]